MHGSVDITDLSFGYTESEPVFSGIDLSLAPGQVFCLLGPNGSGKSTLLKCIMQVLTPNAGRVAVDGQNLNGLSASQIASKLGFVPQSLVSAFPFTVAEIVVMGRASQIRMTASPSKKDRDLAMAALERMGIAHLALRPCHQLSGGEWQQVLIARALTHSPQVLLLDEPTSHLDIGNQVKILEIVNRLAQDGITILMASHFPDHAFLTAHQVGILKNGRLLALGNPDDTLCESVLYDTYGIHIRVVTIGKEVNRKICIPVLQEINRPVPAKEVS
ncbi:ABC transporter ATP-binding protein [Desulfotignum phosphitoxidans]|uniref:Iron(3+)-hydroxamate import ATP-binding protein FhuC n=1 Tax=Desulfotignum phosphitoxidans DSM 13687 TaxID=1286635 RepID=S0G158_9BACT|nr:ABC transporter ATP-binding protein [Desulfotignum phosphitoxidans]EMS77932.1 iron(3+)-hydroxamate import ATP-binding protein FhuC [Desulfotignum phosphitoxidans DSM 13687]